MPRAGRLRAALALALAGILLAVAPLSGCGGEEEPLPPAPLRIATGNPGGVYAVYGAGLADVARRHLPRLRPSALRTDGSVSNLALLQAGRAEVAFTLADSAAVAVARPQHAAPPPPIAALAHLYDNYVQLIVRSGSGIRRLGDLSGRRVSIGAPGSGTSLIARRVLRLARLRGPDAPRRRALDVSQSAAALADGRIDAFFWSGGLPTPAIDELRREVPIRLIDLRGVAARLADRYGDLYTETRIPTTAYGPGGEVTTVSVANLLVVRRDLDGEVAYRLTRLLFEHRDELRRVHREAARLNPRSAIATFPLALHAGAQRWYRERP